MGATTQIISGKYRLEERIGQGAMGIVYRATDILLNKTVALKFLKRELAGDVSQRKRFLNEARIVLHFVHQTAATVREVCEWKDTLYIVMDYYDGKTLKEILAARPLTLVETDHLAQQLLDCLKEAHSQEVLHRDIKPSNLMITEKEGGNLHLHILDFGLACWHDGPKRQAKVCGTLLYMSPEQLLGESADHRSDLYSAAVCIYEMVTGSLPVTGDSPDQFIYNLLKRNPVAPYKKKRSVPRAVSRVILKALCVDPEMRYQSAEDFSKDLKTAFNNQSLPGRKIGGVILAIALFMLAVMAFFHLYQESEEAHMLKLARLALKEKKYQEASQKAFSVLVKTPNTEALDILRKSQAAWLIELEKKGDYQAIVEILEAANFNSELDLLLKEYLKFYRTTRDISQQTIAGDYRSALQIALQYKGNNSHQKILLQQARRLRLRLYLKLFTEALEKKDSHSAQKWLEKLKPNLSSEQLKELEQKLFSLQSKININRP